MATHLFSHAFLCNSKAVASILSRSFTSLSLSSKHPSRSLSTLFLNRLRPLTAVSVGQCRGTTGPTVRGLATRPASSSVNDLNPNWSNRPPKETILLDGCDFEHWLVVMEPPEGDPTRDEIIDSYIKTLAMAVGSEEEARMKIYSVSTRCYYAFGALVSEELSHQLKGLPRVRWVLPDSYLDVKNKDYGGEPFINGQAVPYDPKYHEEWIRNNARANERNRRNDRPRNFDRSRNYERRRENMQNRDFQSQGMQNPPPNASGPPPNNMPPSGNMPPIMGKMPPSVGSMPQNNYRGVPPQSNYGGGPPQDNYRGGPAQSNYGGGPPQTNYGGPPQTNYGGPPQNNYGGGPPQSNYGGGPPQNNYGGGPPQSNYGGGLPQNNYGGVPPQNNYGVPPQHNYGGMPPNSQGNMGGVRPNAGWSDDMPGNMQQSADGPTYHYQNAVPNKETI